VVPQLPAAKATDLALADGSSRVSPIRTMMASEDDESTSTGDQEDVYVRRGNEAWRQQRQRYLRWVWLASKAGRRYLWEAGNLEHTARRRGGGGNADSLAAAAESGRFTR